MNSEVFASSKGLAPDRGSEIQGLQAIHPGPKTSKPHPQNKIYPYLLRNLNIDRANQVWASDITYLPMEKGFIYLTVIIDWSSRKVLSWRLSNSMYSSFCVDTLEEAIHRYGNPEIFNTDQGSQYTSEAFTLESSVGRSKWLESVGPANRLIYNVSMGSHPKAQQKDNRSDGITQTQKSAPTTSVYRIITM